MIFKIPDADPRKTNPAVNPVNPVQYLTMADRWIIQVEGKDYGPVDLETLREWKTDGRVLSANPARRSDSEDWQTAGEIPGLFGIEPPPVQMAEDRGQRTEAGDRQSEISDHKPETKLPRRNLFTETFRIYFRGFFQFLTL